MFCNGEMQSLQEKCVGRYEGGLVLCVKEFLECMEVQVADQ